MFDVCARFKNNCELSMIRSIKVQEVNSLLINFNDLNDRTFWKLRCHKNCICSHSEKVMAAVRLSLKCHLLMVCICATIKILLNLDIPFENAPFLYLVTATTTTVLLMNNKNIIHRPVKHHAEFWPSLPILIFFCPFEQTF